MQGVGAPVGGGPLSKMRQISGLRTTLITPSGMDEELRYTPDLLHSHVDIALFCDVAAC